MAAPTLTLRIVLVAPPPGVAFSLQDKASRPVGPVVSDHGDLAFEVQIALTETATRFGGPFVRSDSRGRFVYVAAGGAAGDHGATWQRRAKIYLDGLPAEAGAAFEARIAGRARDGGPPAATVPLLEGWRRLG